MWYSAIVMALLLLGAFYIGHMHGMATMADQLADEADENANPDAND